MLPFGHGRAQVRSDELLWPQLIGWLWKVLPFAFGGDQIWTRFKRTQKVLTFVFEGAQVQTKLKELVLE